MILTHLLARELLDSRGRPTLEAELHTTRGAVGRAAVPSGASTGRHEALERRDGDPNRYGGRGVRQAVACLRETVAPVLLGRDWTDQAQLDAFLCQLDGTPNKSQLGGNAVLAVSLAFAQAAAAEAGLPLWRHLRTLGAAEACLPVPMVNMISGGLHAGGNLDLQDFLFVPTQARSFSEALEQVWAVHYALGQLLRQQGYEASLVADEGGYGPRLRSSEQALDLLVDACRHAGVVPAIALDVAATHFFRQGRYHLTEQGARVVESGWMVERLVRWCAAYPIVSIEDGLAEDDWDGWKQLSDQLPQVQLVGDDLFVTNPARLQQGIQAGVANAVLIKVNQVGTLSETWQVLRLAQQAGYRAVVSARSGETEESWLADLAVASGAGQIKVGAITRSERLAKYNQLLRIEEMGLVLGRWQPVTPPPRPIA
ncbi:MAG: phosphopyruvate hydratase [Gemmataceae bacterium]